MEHERDDQAAKDAAVEEEAVAHEQEEKAKEGKKQGANPYTQNPIIVINAVSIASASVLLMVGAYKKRQAGKLSWKLVGLWTAGLAAFGAADYFVSRYGILILWLGE